MPQYLPEDINHSFVYQWYKIKTKKFDFTMINVNKKHQRRQLKKQEFFQHKRFRTSSTLIYRMGHYCEGDGVSLSEEVRGKILKLTLSYF